MTNSLGWRSSVLLPAFFWASAMLALGCGSDMEDPTPSTTVAPQANHTQQPLYGGEPTIKPGDLIGEEWSGNVQMLYYSCDGTARKIKEVRRIWSWPANSPEPTYYELDPGC